MDVIKKQRIINSKFFIDLEKYPIVVFGILRGTGDLIKQCEKINHTYYHIDHSYHFKSVEHKINNIFDDNIYRITKNGNFR